MVLISRLKWCNNNKMPTYKIELNVGISDKLADHIVTTYGANILKFERQGNYTSIIAFAPTPQAINVALEDLRSRIAEVEEVAP